MVSMTKRLCAQIFVALGDTQTGKKVTTVTSAVFSNGTVARCFTVATVLTWLPLVPRLINTLLTTITVPLISTFTVSIKVVRDICRTAFFVEQRNKNELKIAIIRSTFTTILSPNFTVTTRTSIMTTIDLTRPTINAFNDLFICLGRQNIPRHLILVGRCLVPSLVSSVLMVRFIPMTLELSAVVTRTFSVCLLLQHTLPWIGLLQFPLTRVTLSRCSRLLLRFRTSTPFTLLIAPNPLPIAIWT